MGAALPPAGVVSQNYLLRRRTPMSLRGAFGDEAISHRLISMPFFRQTRLLRFARNDEQDGGFFTKKC
jgi:hypothetical protein